MDSSSAKLERMASLLAIARGSLNEGQPSLALQARKKIVIHKGAIKAQGGKVEYLYWQKVGDYKLLQMRLLMAAVSHAAIVVGL
eukprot:jgi/Mesen1/4457/ME000227S03474